MITALNQAVPNTNFSATTIAANQATLAAARAEVITAVSALTNAKGAYDAALSGAQTASNSATQGIQSDIASAQANLKSAQGALDAAKAALEKTIVRSPISGTIISLPVRQGDFVPNFAQIAVVSNPDALYVDIQVTPDDAKTLSVGNPAMVENTVPGTITFVAPALDPATGKIEVKVGLIDSHRMLTDGEVVSVSLARNKVAATKAQAAQIAIPIVSIKMTPDGPVVFTVTASSTLAAHAVQLGPILGNRVVVTGISPDAVIITDARGHSAGEKVIVSSSSAASE
jgi:RND family efflux transporter MFP subunit